MIWFSHRLLVSGLKVIAPSKWADDLLALNSSRSIGNWLAKTLMMR